MRLVITRNNFLTAERFQYRKRVSPHAAAGR